MSEYLDHEADDSDDIFSEPLGGLDARQYGLVCFCETCGFMATLPYEEGERDMVKDIAKSIHEQKFPKCNGKLVY